ncbi:MAG: hypothetical protein A3I33_02460 [Candidatus Colwellbacteria bacterium RIFCSPLOWO2_02_FULL_45_11]|uniref:Uncharacterized protein n=1 Tax=Candidatus Colwellbacteria bacterium RIFCSPLOWO2_02_FULL_45_11 TaxID=1797692 RepID=A0A1G1Z8E9_9BACT|nr:MAG: hypothetical protein A3I33_02460 [Candidatus Colwellbacteria bacterium RIFCSPLOWO2_02_FULL_45_11]
MFSSNFKKLLLHGLTIALFVGGAYIILGWESQSKGDESGIAASLARVASIPLALLAFGMSVNFIISQKKKKKVSLANTSLLLQIAFLLFALFLYLRWFLQT